MFEDIKNLVKMNFKDLNGIINSDFIVYWFLLSLIFLLFPLLNVLALILFFATLIFFLRYFIREVGMKTEFLEFFVNPGESSIFPKIEGIWKDKRELKISFMNSFLLFFMLNIGLFIFLFFFYIFLLLVKVNFFLKSMLIILLVLFMFFLVLLQISLYIFFPLLLLKAIENDSYKELFFSILTLWDDFYDENTLIFFRSLIFDLFWRFVILILISLPVILFFILFFKFLIINFWFSLFIGWLCISFVLGLFFTFFTIDFVKNYYVYFHYV